MKEKLYALAANKNEVTLLFLSCFMMFLQLEFSLLFTKSVNGPLNNSKTSRLLGKVPCKIL